ncbi:MULTISPECIES: exodeoxyribonuclease VII small subunit [Proteiniphilum]|jgi:exodeoxyribonuclease VII small subunit|uniref:exodeoxyribonuclease VII small subunit n=1 Tax=Proteiniphilum TaxID=294702 RepID=UPI001EEA9CA7|nr:MULTISPECIES: exodeoxyribonuclease VII small subunit [Proteiniphilum]MDD2246162.1 exodeoxyribonuclease VII small subunit [Proteiniphilum sp.]MDD3909199.1 exodeoxyribonuclease VII small subunit [Proteiniphilum sp.]MDD4416756.1 exodeoxyribonuclease VII small subunit [Proteiniphilum sp.]ULB35371.1 exodeoxyribonuclease VII small subunit [Proteiniphilum propionicum]
MEKLTYTQAKKELETIVLAIESGELDVDALTDKVKRASELIAFCKEKLTRTDKELQKILDDIE